MSFGTKYIKGNEKDRLSSLKKNDKDVFEKEDELDVSNNSKTVNGNNLNAKTKHLNDSSSYDVRNHTQNTSTIKNNYNKKPKPKDYKNRDDKNALLIAKAVRLVKEVGDYFKWSMVDINKKEKEAKQQPQKIIEELLVHYKNINKNKAEIKEIFINEMADNPDQLMFLLIKNGKKRKVTLSDNQAEEQKVLHGAILESVTYELSGFPKPSDIFSSKKNNDSNINSTEDSNKKISKEKIEINQHQKLNSKTNNIKKNSRFTRN